MNAVRILGALAFFAAAGLVVYVVVARALNHDVTAWPIIAILACICGALGIYGVHLMLLRRASRVGRCDRCGYDLAGLEAEQRCPECGTSRYPE